MVRHLSFIHIKPLTELTRRTAGDFVGIGPSVTNQFQKWPGMAATYSSIIYRPAMTMFAHDGTFVGGPFVLSESSHYRPVPVSRPKLIRALYDYATSLGIPILFGKRVVDYEESNETNRAYAITDKGERFEADNHRWKRDQSDQQWPIRLQGHLSHQASPRRPFSRSTVSAPKR